MYLKIKELCLILVIHAIIDVTTQDLPRSLIGKECSLIIKGNKYLWPGRKTLRNGLIGLKKNSLPTGVDRLWFGKSLDFFLNNNQNTTLKETTKLLPGA
jgi:hypothetical protein